MRKSLAVFFLITVCASRVFAWSGDGHRIVCRIAFVSLSPQDQKEVTRLASLYKTPEGKAVTTNGYPDACVFPDEARGKVQDAIKVKDKTSPWLVFHPFDDWHFLNVERTVKKIPATACGDNCVLFGITKHSADLKSATTDQKRAEALIFLGHWVGDVHQPLHVSYKEDKGGNNIEPVTGGFYPIPKPFDKDKKPVLNLHSVWDASIIRQDLHGLDLLGYADALQKKITADQRKTWLASAPLQWAQESYDITTSSDVQYCKTMPSGCEALKDPGRVLNETYQTKFAPDVELRLEQAGTRLASLIQAALHPAK
ncbi:MAG TPA: S1/P1 nuclease [Thermoanaerobaculia bacterium]|jgi:hypothetical protein|nr:S1/P1 nuclease [Thermoanaerobaculia bacterium]